MTYLTHLAVSAAIKKLVHICYSANKNNLRRYANNKYFANCVGIVERPVWVMYDADEIVEWDMRPMANGNQSAMNNYRSIKLR